MQKVMYLHGLESKPGGEKVEFLEKHFEVLAPECDYKNNENIFFDLLSQAQDFQPDIIIGSSMGGYMAYYISQHLNRPIILFNPALAYQPIKRVVKVGPHKPSVFLGLGFYDEVVPSFSSFNILGDSIINASFGKHTHQTPFYFFTKVIREVTGLNIY